MTARPIRRLIAALGLVMLPLMAGAQPAPPPPLIFLEPVSGDCSELNNKMESKGVTDVDGKPHREHWGWTTYKLLINGLTFDDHNARNFIDLLDSFSIHKVMRQDSAGTRTCLHASGFDIEFGAQTSITRLHWDPLFPPCQPCATEWANLMTLIDSHEKKHLTDISKALVTANSEWPREFPWRRVIEVCGPPGVMIVRNLSSKLMNEIAAQLKDTWTILLNQIEKYAIDLHNVEPSAPMNCSACLCSVPAECKDVTVSPHKMRGGAPASGAVTLLAAPPGGAEVLLRTDSVLSSLISLVASIPSQINVPEGGTNQTFGINLTPVQQLTKGFIYATRPGAGRICRAELWVYPPELVKLVTPEEMHERATYKGTVTLNTVAPTSGIPVKLSATPFLSVPTHVVVPAGALEADFEMKVIPPPHSPYDRREETTAEWDGTKIVETTNIKP
jgi:hypothetical protein